MPIPSPAIRLTWLLLDHLQAGDAEWDVAVSYSYDQQSNKTVYTFTVDARSSSSCGSPESLSVRWARSWAGWRLH